MTLYVFSASLVLIGAALLGLAAIGRSLGDRYSHVLFRCGVTFLAVAGISAYLVRMAR